MGQKSFWGRYGKWIIGLFLIAVVGGVVAYLNFSVYGVEPDVVPDTTGVAATTYTFSVVDPYDGDNEDIEDAQVNIWILDYSDWTASQLEDLSDDREDYSNYEFEESKDWDDAEIDPEVDCYYIASVNLTGYCEVWMTSFYATTLGYPQRMGLGVNNVYLVNQTETMAIEAHSINNGTQAVLETTERDWEVSILCQDTDGDLTKLEGYKTYYDVVNSAKYSILIRVEFNTTAVLGWVTYQDSGLVSYVASGNYIYMEFDAIMINGVESFDIRFASTITTTFEAASIAIGYGSAASATIAAALV